MASIKQFEDIGAWQEARALVRDLYATTGIGHFAQDFGLRDQIRRAAVSIMSNIAEGFERGSDKDFARFLFMAKGSAGEVRSQLYVASDLGYLEPQQTSEIMDKAQSVSRQISGFIKYLQSSEPKSRSRRTRTPTKDRG